MFARHVTLGRAVIVAAGLLVFLAITTQVFASADRPWLVTMLGAGAILGFMGVLVGGRAGGRWWARRRGTDVEEGGRRGFQAGLLLMTIALAVARWLGV